MKPLSVALLGVIAICWSYATAFNGKNLDENIVKGTSLLIAEPHQISQLFLDPPVRQLLQRTDYIGGLDYDGKRQRVYWSEISTGRINARNLTGTYNHHGDECFIELSPKQWRPRAIAIDSLADNMYVLDTRGKKVHVVDLESRLRTVVFEGNNSGERLKAPTDIAVDPTEAVMFVADDRRILRFNMDGSQPTLIVSHPRYRIKSLTLDTANKRIFWSDLAYHRIKSANYDGTDVRVWIKNQIGKRHDVLGPSQLAYHDGSLYFHDDVYRTICARAIDATDYSTDRLVYDRVDVRSIKVANPASARRARLLPADNPCDDRAGCEQLCLIANKLDGRLASKCAYSVADN